MTDPFEVLGISRSADAAEVRRAYHALAMKWHPDHFQDPEQQKKAQTRMVAINAAYNEALKQVNGRSVPFNRSLSCEDAMGLARRMLIRQGPASALRQLMRAESKNAEWYYLQGLVLMQMDQYDSAHQSFREAVRREPDNNRFRQGALEAAVAFNKSKTILGRLQLKLKQRRQEKKR